MHPKHVQLEKFGIMLKGRRKNISVFKISNLVFNCCPVGWELFYTWRLHYLRLNNYLFNAPHVNFQLFN